MAAKKKSTVNRQELQEMLAGVAMAIGEVRKHGLRHLISALAACWDVFGLSWGSLLLQSKFSPVANTYLLVC